MKTKVVIPAKERKRTMAGRRSDSPAKDRNDAPATADSEKIAEQHSTPPTDIQNNGSSGSNLYSDLFKNILLIRSQDDAEAAIPAYRALFPGSLHVSAKQLLDAADVMNLFMRTLMTGPPPDPNDQYWQAQRAELNKRLSEMGRIARGGQAAFLFRVAEMAEGLLRTKSTASPELHRSIATNFADALRRLDRRFGSLSADDLLEMLSLARKNRWQAPRLAEELVSRARFPKKPSADAFSKSKRIVTKRMGLRNPTSGTGSGS